ncbi:MAG: cation transporter [Thermoanaerobaculia bacterium]
MKRTQSTITTALVVVGLAAAIGVRTTIEPAVAADAETEQTVALRVDGMQNAGCAMQVRHTLEGLEGVTSATVDLGTARARVEYDPERVGPETMITAVNAVGYRASLPDGSTAAAAPDAGAHTATGERLTAEEIDQVADFVAEQLLDQGSVPAEENIQAATGLMVSVADLPAVQAAVVTRLAADPRGQELIAGSRCSDYGACSLWRNLAGATGEELKRYEREKSRDGERLDGTPLPKFTANDLDGREVRSRDLAGRPALVTLLAVHCTHSMDTFPVLQELHRQFGPQGLQVVGVLVHSGSAEDAQSWVPRFAPEYPVWVHEDASLGDEIGSRLVPTYLLVDAEGRMRQILVGFKSREQVAAAVQSSLGLTPNAKGGETS